MKNNEAVVVKVSEVLPIKDADKIVEAVLTLDNIGLGSVVVGKDEFKSEDLAIYFDSNLCLSQVILDDNPVLSTYLGKNGRIQIIKLKNTISMGLVTPIKIVSSYYKKESDFTKIMVEGYSFLEIEGTEICHKYVPPVKHEPSIAGKKGKKPKVSRIVEGQFAFHIDTEQFFRNTHKVKPNDVISISSKFHGTSSITANVLVKRKKTFSEKLIFWDKTEKTEYDTLYASRTVIKNSALDAGGFYKFDIWKEAGEKYFKGKLAKGESVYYEIVGYLPTGAAIQASKTGKCYDYGNKPKEYSIRVYRITITTPDNVMFELGWKAMRDRCVQLGVDPVVEYYFGQAKDLFPELDVAEHWNENFAIKIKQTYLEKDSPHCINKLPDEGVVIRVEAGTIQVYKAKSERFLLDESDKHEAGEADLEEEQAVAVE
jgi:hypothetical protein